MGQPMRRFMKAGIILHISYPQLGGGKEPILEYLERICGDDYFEAVEVARMKDGQIRKKAVEVARTTHMVSVYDGQSRTLSTGLDTNDLDETRRAMAVDTLKEGVDEVYKVGYAGFSFLRGRYDKGWGKQILEQLPKSTRQLCGYVGEEGNMPICYKIFDYNIDRGALIGPAALATHYVGEVRRNYGNSGLLMDLSHIPVPHETIEESILPVRDYIVHAHMGNTVIKSSSCEAYGDNYLRSGSPDSENDVEELIHYLRTLMEIGFLGEKKWLTVSFEVKPWRDESPEVIIANTKRALNLAWELV